MESKLSMKLLAGTEAVFFLCLIMSFVYLVYYSPELAMTKQLNVSSMSLFTGLLIGSSGTYWLAENFYKKGNIKTGRLFLFLTILLGIIFLYGEGKEYAELLHKQVTFSQGTFGTGFYTLTGFHGLHVLIGLIILSVLAGISFRSKLSVSAISTAGIYWHFVDVVWLFVFTVVYILPGLI